MGKRQRKLPSIDLWWAEWLRPLHLSEWWWLRQIVAKRLHTSQNCRKKGRTEGCTTTGTHSPEHPHPWAHWGHHTPEFTMNTHSPEHPHSWAHHGQTEALAHTHSRLRTPYSTAQEPNANLRNSRFWFFRKKKYIFYYRDQFLEMYMLKWTMSNQFRILIPPTIFCRSHHHWRW